MSALDDELDYQILKLLQKDGRMSFTEISKEIPKDSFIVPAGFEKVKMEEFKEKMGG